MKILMNVDYRDESGKYYLESSIRNSVYEIGESEPIHIAIKRILTDADCIEFSYNGKDKGNIYIDTEEGSIQVGYTFRIKADIDVNYQIKKGLFTAWVSIYKIIPFTFPKEKEL